MAAINTVNVKNTNYAIDGSKNNYGTCSTAAATAAKVVTVSGVPKLEVGSEVVVKFTATNTASNPTLNVNGLGAKAIYNNGNAINAGDLKANHTYTFRYNGTQWDLASISQISAAETANNLTTTDSGYALDARQGKILNDSKLAISNVVNNLTTTTAGYALDARQGKALNDDKLSKTGASSDNTVAFTSNDSATVFNSGNLAGQSAYPWTAVAQMASGEKHSSLFNKASTMFKNIRYIAKLIGTTDISEVGDGTLSGAISTINTNLSADLRRIPKNISSSLSNLPTAISEQNLAKYDYAIGDYFVGPSGYVYWLADMDTFYGGYAYYAVVNKHHCGVVVDTKLTSAYLSSGTLAGYSTSTLHSLLKGTVLNTIKTDIASLFGNAWTNHLIPHTKLYNTVSSWAWSGNNNNTEYISALTEMQMYGGTIWSSNGYQQGEGDKQLELFRKFKYNQIFGNISIWLRSIYSASDACFAGGDGDADDGSVTVSVRAAGLILLY